jgi:rare lipoprotein A
MRQNILSGTAAALFLATIATPLSGHSESVDETPQIRSASASARTLGSPTVNLPSEQKHNPGDSSSPHASGSGLPKSGSSQLVIESPTSPRASSFSGDANPAKPTVVKGEVVKMGEQLPASGGALKHPTPQNRTAVVAKVHSHILSGRRAATLYVRNIPVLTFIGAPTSDSPEPEKLGEQAETFPLKSTPDSTKALSSTDSPGIAVFAEFKFSSQQNESRQDALGRAPTPSDKSDPVWRASEIAAKLNDLNRQGIDGSKITVSPEGDRYQIKVGDTALALMDANTRLPDSTQDGQQDALQATNRLRRLLGNAEPLSTMPGLGSDWFDPTSGMIDRTVSGLASWYGPGFNGNMSASGEIFNQNALTAAHRTLPFGTRVRVTNMDNGTSVVVRINDRGPFSGDRVLDLSMGAARVLGLIQSGVAPVRLDILTQQTARNE